ncbi:MAG: hypothetical protein RL375_3637 [Pseudomonadota bacterium]
MHTRFEPLRTSCASSLFHPPGTRAQPTRRTLAPRPAAGRWLPGLWVALLPLWLAGCGGGDDSGGVVVPPPVSGSVTVAASLGVVANADVSVTCAPTGAVLGTGSTSSTGQVVVTTSGSCAGPVLVTVSGRADGTSTYFDEALVSPALFPSGTRLRAVAPALANPLSLGVTALTEIAARQALATAGSLGALTSAQVTAANAAVVTQVLGAGVTLDILTPPTPWQQTTAAGSLGTSAADRYAFYLAGLARMGLGETAPALAVTNALGGDLADGTLSGASNGGFAYTSSANLATQLSSGLNAMGSYANSALQTALGIVAGTPVVLTSVTPSSGAVGDNITIAGSGFNADPTKLSVKFAVDVPATVVSASATSVVVKVPTGASNGAISITNLATSLSGSSSASFTVTGGSQATVPAVPAGLSATPTSATQIQLNWAAAVGAASYNIYRATSAGVVTSAANLVNTSAVVPTAFADSGLAASTTYFYKITALNSVGESVGSTEVSASTLSANALVWRNATASRHAVIYDRAYYLNGKFMTLHFPGVVSSSTDGATWTSSQTGKSDSLKELAFGNGRYVAAAVTSTTGNNFISTLYSSADGVTWTAATNLPVSVIGRRIDALAFGNGKFTAIVSGGGADVIQSTDGITWTTDARTVFANEAIALAYGNGIFVAYGLSVQISTDGVIWTKPVLGTTMPNRMKFVNGQFMALLPAGQISTSTDGITWSTRSTGSTRALNDIDYGNGLYAIAGAFNAQTVTGTLLVSTDGQTWTPNDLGAVAPVQHLNGMAFGNGKFLSAGSLGALIITP